MDRLPGRRLDQENAIAQEKPCRIHQTVIGMRGFGKLGNGNGVTCLSNDRSPQSVSSGISLTLGEYGIGTIRNLFCRGWRWMRLRLMAAGVTYSFGAGVQGADY